ncbi:MAG TPA: zinc-ribbon domain-containing protein [Longimicrobiales bacterium]
MNIRCPSCQTTFRVDPSRIPAGGVRARCARCNATFPVTLNATAAPLSSAGQADDRTQTAAAPSMAQGLAGTAGSMMGTMAAGAAAMAGATAAAVDAAVRSVSTAMDGGSSAGDDAESESGERPADGPAGTTSTWDAVPSAGATQSAPVTPSVSGTVPAPAPAAPRATSFPSPRPAHAPANSAGEPRPAIFGSRDPAARAQRMARALVSDIVAYHPKKREESLARGTMRQDFREEIMKSWEEYVAQVGVETAKSTPYFRDALNAILAKGQSVF